MNSEYPFIPDDESRDELYLNPRSVGFLALIAEDLATHRKDPLSQGFLAILSHRLANQLKSIRPLALRVFALFIHKVIARFIEGFTGITILHNTILGRRVHIWHHGGIILNANRIGDDVTIRQCTTIGQNFHGSGRPIIESHVNIGCNVVIIGSIRIGTMSTIGAQTLVCHDVAAHSRVVCSAQSVTTHAPSQALDL